MIELKIIKKKNGTRLDIDKKLWDKWRGTPSIDFDGHPFVILNDTGYRISNAFGPLEYDRALEIIKFAVEHAMLKITNRDYRDND